MRRSKLCRHLLAAAAAALPLFAARAALATEYVVSPAGNDAGTGLAGAPFATLQRAVSAVRPGDVVTVEDGTYAGFLVKNVQATAAAPITFRARHRLGAAIASPNSGGLDGIDLVSSSYVVIDGFDVHGQPRAGIEARTLGDVTGGDTRGDVIQNCHSHHNGGGTTAGQHDGIFTGFALDVVIQDNEVDHNGEHGVYVSNAADDPIMRRNRSHENLANGLQINADVSTGGDGVITNWLIEDNVVWGNGGGAAINLDGAAFGVLRNNLVYANANAGITLFKGDAAEASHDNLVVNNTVVNLAGTRAALQVADGADHNVVFNNILYAGTGPGIEVQAVNGLEHDANVFSSLTGCVLMANEATPPIASVVVDPTADFRPAAAAIDRGEASLDANGAPATDLAGAARPEGGAFDLGCYEANAAPPPADAGTPLVDGGGGHVDGGSGYVDGGSGYVDGGSGHVDGGSGYVDGGDAHVDGGRAHVNEGGAPVNEDDPPADAGPAVGCDLAPARLPEAAHAFLLVLGLGAFIRLFRRRA